MKVEGFWQTFLSSSAAEGEGSLMMFLAVCVKISQESQSSSSTTKPIQDGHHSSSVVSQHDDVFGPKLPHGSEWNTFLHGSSFIWVGVKLRKVFFVLFNLSSAIQCCTSMTFQACSDCQVFSSNLQLQSLLDGGITSSVSHCSPSETSVFNPAPTHRNSHIPDHQNNSLPGQSRAESLTHQIYLWRVCVLNLPLDKYSLPLIKQQLQWYIFYFNTLRICKI